MNDDVKTFILRCRVRYSPETLRGKISAIRAYFTWLERQRLDYRTITQPAVESFILACRESQRKRTLFTLYQFYKFLDEQHNPAENIVVNTARRDSLPKQIPAQTVIERQIVRIRDPRDEITLRNRLMVELAYGSGLRRAEIAALDIEDMDLAQSSACVRRGKGGKARIVPLTRAAMDTMREYLRERRAARGPLIVNYSRKERMNPGSIGAMVKKITGYNIHAYRHACATHMLQAGCDLRYIQELLGHEGIGTTRIYTRIDTAHLSKVIGKAHPRARKVVRSRGEAG